MTSVGSEILVLHFDSCDHNIKTLRESHFQWKKMVAVTLWRLDTNIKYRPLAHLFGMGLSTVCAAVHDVCTAIVEISWNGI